MWLYASTNRLQPFYINVVIIGLFSPIYFFSHPSVQPQPGWDFITKFGCIDWLGMAFNAGIYITWVLIFTFGSAMWPWNDSHMIAIFITLGILIIGYSYNAVF
jgi:hypothetical protein